MEMSQQSESLITQTALMTLKTIFELCIILLIV